MTQVWMVRNSDTDIHVFNRREHLRPSVNISYSRCEGVTITEHWEARTVTFTIEGTRTKDAGEHAGPFKDVIVARCLPVWTEPSHL